MDVVIFRLAEKFKIYSRIYEVPSIWPEKQNESILGRTVLENKRFYWGYTFASLCSSLFAINIFRILGVHVLSSEKDADLTFTAGLLSTVIGLFGLIAARFDYETLFRHKDFGFVVNEMKKLYDRTSGK